MTDASPEQRAEEPDEPLVVKLDRRNVEDARFILRLLSRGYTRILIEVENSDRPVARSPEKALLQRRASEIVSNRRRRYGIFSKAMFGEPAWDMLLLLYADDSGPRQTVARLIDQSGATKTTALRWLDYIEAQRLVRRETHPTDKRVHFVELTESGREAIELYISGTLGADN